MEGVWGMGDQISSFLGLAQSTIGNAPDPTDSVLKSVGQQIEKKLQRLYEDVYALLDEHREKVLELAGVLVQKKTISGDDVAEILGSPQGARTIHRPKGWIAFDPDAEGLDVAEHGAIPTLPDPNVGKAKKTRAGGTATKKSGSSSGTKAKTTSKTAKAKTTSRSRSNKAK
jgi:hypothetical protein